MNQTLKKVKVKSKIIAVYAIAIAIACFILYLIIPYMLNYAPGTINTLFDKQVSGGLYYYQQILIATISLITVVSVFLYFKLKDIDNYPIFIKDKEKYKKNIQYIEKVCLSLPNRLLLIFIVIPIILAVLVLFMQTTYLSSSDFKLMLIIFIVSTTTISIANTFIRKELSAILVKLENTSYANVRRTSLVTKLLFQLLPIMAVCIVFTYLAVSSVYERNNADLLSGYYNNQFKSDIENATIFNKDDLINILNTIELSSENDVLFIANSSFNFIYQTGEISDFFKKYANELSADNQYRVYDYYGTTGQGILYPLTTEFGETYYLGASYLIYSDDIVSIVATILVVLALICALILYAFASELSKDVKEVNDSLQAIANDSESFTGKQLYVTSVDEIGDLIKSYNNIQAITTNHLDQIHNSQQTLMERERLASLGQLIGGIAHNLKTPIMSISGATEGLNDLIKEYDSSIDDPEVNSQDHHEIANDMRTWTDRIKTHTEYMSDIITAVKGQAVTLGADEKVSFTIEELIKMVNILMKHELKNAIVYLNVSLSVDSNLSLKGDVTSLVQVINNMISNSIQAYDGKPNQNIDMHFALKDNNLIISIRDYAGGLPQKVQDKLFKEMITTKGKNGTGLGLYMSYSNIKARFNGDITFETNDKGTTFNIILPL